MTATAAAGPASRETSTEVGTVAARRVLAPVTAALAVVTVVVGLVRAGGVEIPLEVQLVPFAVSILVFGLPHGALDHLVPARLRGDGRVLRSVAVVVALYAVLGVATAALWLVAPLAGMLLGALCSRAVRNADTILAFLCGGGGARAAAARKNGRRVPVLTPHAIGAVASQQF